MRYRHEYKYLLNPGQEALLTIQAAGLMARDSHVDRNGGYIVRSLYFDDALDNCMLDNMRGADPRAKYRVRYYNDDLSYIMLEKKIKHRGMTRKEQCRISADECATLMRGEVLTADAEDKTKQKLFSELQMRAMTPKVIVVYERIPFVYPAGNVRITFDRCLAASDDTAKFLTRDHSLMPVYALGQSLLEVKWDELLPRHLKETFVQPMANLTWTAFSKYCMCRRLYI